MTPLGQAAGRKNLAKFLGIDMRAGSTGGLMMVMVMMMVVMMVVMMVMMMVMLVMTRMMMIVVDDVDHDGYGGDDQKPLS